MSESLMGRGIGYFLGTVSIGTTFDRFPKQAHVILFLSSFFVSLSTLLIPLYTFANTQKYANGSNVGIGRWLLLAALLFQGVAAGCVDLGGNVLLTRLFSGDIARLSPRMNLLHCMWGVGATLGPIVALSLGLQPELLPRTYGVIAGIGLVLALPVLFLNSPPIKGKKIKSLSAAAVVVVEMKDPLKNTSSTVESGGGMTASTPSPPSPTSPTSPTSPSTSSTSSSASASSPPPPRSVSLIIFFLVYYFMYAGIEHIMGDWIATFANIAPVGVTVETGALLVSLYFGSMSIGRLLTAIATSKPTWSKILTPTKLITFDLMLALASYILLVSVGSYSLIPMIVSVSGIGLAFSSMYPMGLALAETKFQPTGLQQSMFVGGAPLGGIILPTIIGTVSCSINLCFSF